MRTQIISPILSIMAVVVAFGSVPTATAEEPDEPAAAVTVTVTAANPPPSTGLMTTDMLSRSSRVGSAVDQIGPALVAPDRGSSFGAPGPLAGWADYSFNELLRAALADQNDKTLSELSLEETLIRQIILQEGDFSDDEVGSLDPAVIDALLTATATEVTAEADQQSVMANPVPGARLFDSFGFPRSNGRRHRGIDIFAPAGSPVVAAVAGVVVQVRGPGARPEGRLGGRTVTIRGTDGNFHYYAHNSVNHVAEGDTVAQGEIIALVGNTGNARTTPPHLHYGISVGGTSFSEARAINPFPLLMAAANGQPLPPVETLMADAAAAPPLPITDVMEELLSGSTTTTVATIPTTSAVADATSTTASTTTIPPTTTVPTTVPTTSSQPTTTSAPSASTSSSTSSSTTTSSAVATSTTVPPSTDVSTSTTTTTTHPGSRPSAPPGRAVGQQDRDDAPPAG